MISIPSGIRMGCDHTGMLSGTSRDTLYLLRKCNSSSGQRFAHRPPHGQRSGTLREPKRTNNETDINGILDGVVGFMRWLGDLLICVHEHSVPTAPRTLPHNYPFVKETHQPLISLDPLTLPH